MQRQPDYTPRYRGSERLKGKVALITGGDSGIGRATAVLFAREGAKLAIVYRDEHEDAKQTLALIEGEGSEGMLIAGDVGERRFCHTAVAEVIDRFGQIDVLVNNAAEQHAKEEFEDIPEEQIERTFRTNIFGQIFIAQAALPHLRRGASIISVTSVTAFKGQPLLIDYAST
ncbi:MAG: SDR family NAD(P)-dependent oxidoreductase, partial [Gemmatimonadetes bacterium]|nr:SDR family NAD(P)-dependent oxidoreductase [Gemmatimonadota bacterium]